MIAAVKTILFASDLSSNARYFFGYAMEMASRYQARIVILHVMEETPPGTAHRVETAFGEELYADLKKRKTDHARHILINKRTEALVAEETIGRMCEAVQSSSEADFQKVVIDEIMVTEGQVADEILAVSQAKNCAAIVMGGPRSGLAEGAFSGSVLRRVLRKTNKPVLVIPWPDKKTKTK